MTDRVVTVVLRGDWSQLKSANAQAAASMRTTAAQMNGIGAKAGRGLTSGLVAATRGFVGLSALYGVGRFLTDTVQLEAQFSKTMNVIGATTGASAQEMERLRDLAKEMGAETSFSASDASEAMLELARGGITPAEIAAGALKGTLTLAAAGEMEMGDAANTAVKAMGAFNLHGKDMNAVAAALAGGANASSASVADMSQSLAQAGLAAHSVGFSIDETTAVLAAFSNAGLEGSDAGTSLKTMLDRLQPTTVAQANAMRELGVITEEGTNRFLNANGTYKSAADIAEVLRQGTEKLTDADRKRLITQAFGSDAQRAATVLAKEGAAGIQEMVKATSDQNAAQDMANANMEGTAGALERLSGSWETLKLSIGEGIAPIVEDGADALADLLGMMAGDGDGPSGFAGDFFDAYVDHARHAWEAVEDIWDGATEGVQNLMDSISGALEDHGGMFDAILRNLGDFSGAFFDTLGPVLGWLANTWLTGLGNEFELLAAGLKLAGNVFFEFSDVALQVMDLVVHYVGDGVGFVIDRFGDLAEAAALLDPTGHWDAVAKGIRDVGADLDNFQADFHAGAEARRADLEQEQYLWNLTGEQADMLRNRILALPDEVRTMIKVPGALDSINEVVRYQKQLGLTDDEVITILQAKGADLAVADIRRLKNAYDATPHEVVTIMKQSGGGLTVREVRDLQRVYDLTPKQVSTLLRATDNATAVITDVQKHGKDLDNDRYVPTIDGNGGPALGVIDNVVAHMNYVDGMQAWTYINVVTRNVRGGVTSSSGGHEAAATGADGLTVPGARHPYGDKTLILAAPGEELITNRHGEADAFRRDRAAGLIPGYASGGTVGGAKKHPATWFRNGGIDANSQLYGIDKAFLSIHELGERLSNLSTKQLRHLSDDFDNLGKRGVAKLSKAFDVTTELVQKDYDDQHEALTTARDALHELRDAALQFKQSVAGNFTGDTWYQANDAIGFSEADALRLSLTNQAASAKAYLQNLQAATGKGLSGGLFNFLAQSGNSQLVDQFAAMGKADIRQYEQLFAQRNQAATSLGEFASDERYGARLDRAERIADRQAQLTQEMRNELREVKQQIKDFNHRGPERTGRAVGEAVNSTIKRGGVKV